MDFKEKYTTDAVVEKEKIEISKEAFAIGEMLEKIFIELNRNKIE